jgi:hypothetical protein
VRPNIGPYASFVPFPGKLYQIKPSSTLFVAVGHYHSRDLVTPGLQEEDTTYKVDFEKLATDHVHLVHRADGVLTMVKTEMEVKSNSASIVGSPTPLPSPVTSSPGTGPRL